MSINNIIVFLSRNKEKHYYFLVVKSALSGAMEIF